MPKATPIRRKKLNQTEIEKKITEQFQKKFTHIIPGEDAVVFKVPDENPLNHFFFHYLPYGEITHDGKFAGVGGFDKYRYYYFPKSKYDNLNALFQAHQIPQEMHDDLRLAYLAMFFSHCTALSSDQVYEELGRNDKELFAALDFLQAIAEGKISLKGVSFEFQERLEGSDEKGRQEYGRLQSRKFKGHQTVQFIKEVLQNYKDCKLFELVNRMYELNKQYGKPDMFFGHKNSEKAYQRLFASRMFEYLTNGLFNSAFDLLHSPTEYSDELKRLEKLYSRRKRFLFIGKMMFLSELLEVEHDDEITIEVIEKKLTPLLKASKRKVQGINERNARSTDSRSEITMFGDLFY